MDENSSLRSQMSVQILNYKLKISVTPVKQADTASLKYIHNHKNAKSKLLFIVIIINGQKV